MATHDCLWPPFFFVKNPFLLQNERCLQKTDLNISRIAWAMAISNLGEKCQNFEKIALADKNIDNSANF